MRKNENPCFRGVCALKTVIIIFVSKAFQSDRIVVDFIRGGGGGGGGRDKR